MFMKVKQNQGFTLIELVVVIIVLAILVAMAIPKFMDLKRDANVSVLQGIKRTVESVIQVSQAKALANGLDQYCLVQSNTTNVTDSEYSTFNKNGCIVGYNAAVNTEVFFQTTYSSQTKCYFFGVLPYGIYNAMIMPNNAILLRSLNHVQNTSFSYNFPFC